MLATLVGISVAGNSVRADNNARLAEFDPLGFALDFLVEISRRRRLSENWALRLSIRDQIVFANRSFRRRITLRSRFRRRAGHTGEEH